MIIICIIDAVICIMSWYIVQSGVYKTMLQINPKKFKHIQNKSIPSPIRPKFRNKNSTNIYFLSKRKVQKEKKFLFIKRFKIAASILIIGISGYILSS